MHSAAALLQIHDRAHGSLGKLLAHCRVFDPEELNRELDGFGVPSVRLQFHHELGAERYWFGMLQGRIDADDDNVDFPDIASLEAFRTANVELTGRYLGAATDAELNSPRTVINWRGEEQVLVPAHVVMRVVTHFYHHQGQILAMCRLLGRPTTGFEYALD